MSALLAEFVGTALLVLLGNGVVANVILQKTKGHGSGLVVIALGWGMAVFVAVFSGGHVNLVVTLALAVAGKFPWADVPGSIAMQMLGGMMGAFLVWVVYHKHLAPLHDDGASFFARLIWQLEPMLQDGEARLVTNARGG